MVFLKSGVIGTPETKLLYQKARRGLSQGRVGLLPKLSFRG
jgi:hypothetical protein